METTIDPSDAAVTVAGRRLVRRLGTGQEWTAYSTVPVEVQPGGRGGGVLAPTVADAVLLRARADAAERSLWRRAAILSRLDHPHIVRLIDVAEDPGGLPCLLVERLAGGTLGELLRRRESIAPGEAVTILAPLVDAVRAAHLAGISHGGIAATAVSFAADGRPVLAGWSQAVAVDRPGLSGGTGQPDPAFVEDWSAFSRLMDGVLRSTPSADQPETESWVAEVAPGLADHEIANRLQQRIHALARPLPVLLDRIDPPTGTAADEIRAAVEHDRAMRSTAPPTRRAVAEARRRTPLTTRLRQRIDVRGGHRSREASADRPAVRRSGPPRRRLILGGAGMAVVLASTAMVLLPPEVPSTADAGSSEQQPSTVQAPSSAPAPVPSVQADAAEAGEGGEGDEAVEGDDPLAAARALVLRRDQCRSSSDATCLWEAVEPGSPFGDEEQVGDGIGSIEAATLELVDRQGDAAVLRGTGEGVATDGGATKRRQPVTLLVVRGETGWRLREVFTAG
ncbi:hypothetical protein ASF83_03935 [Plantibacter sp. Leaf171]|uniref:protein kinase domain-containing protein n=1 Tax=unclassified Plantibacter TaxID=2624265 RepID=UPI0006FF2BED|nr:MULTISPECIES: hypothetical protein [unclassified Plantibacter]KQM15157.1 hypothetical protein ASE44_03950 [Plantibacter sp. Leaf1]KQR58300.1 hypothetical protein ASF83_03935 [Plantibacter sp. Leaf171]